MITEQSMHAANAPVNAGGLPTRSLGRTGLRITPVGLGAWALGGPGWSGGWGAQSPGDSVATIRHAVERGVNWIDTAPIYGLGASEEIVGRALREIPAQRRPYVFTKCGLSWDDANPHAPPSRIGTRRSIRRELHRSLRRLGVDCIDVYFMHFPAADVSLDDYWQTLIELKQSGKVRAIGLSNHDAAQLEAADRYGGVDVFQPRFSAIDRDAASILLTACQSHEVGVIVYSPLQSGLLTGCFSAPRAAGLPSDDWRSRNPEFMGRRLKRNLALAERLGFVASRLCTTVPAVAVAWTLMWPGVSGAIVGARAPTQIDEWIDAARLTLGEAEMLEIADAIRETHAGRGPRLPEGYLPRGDTSEITGHGGSTADAELA